MAEAAAGSVEAFDQLYERYCARVYRLALGICGDHVLAEDAMQEAFLSIWRNSASYRAHRGTVAAWVLTVVRHRAIDLARRNGTAADRQSDVRRPGSHTAADDDPYEEAGARERADHLRALLNRLPDPQHEVVTLAFYGQLTHAEISEQLGLPPGTVKGRMRLGMHKLREALGSPDA